MIHDMGGSNTKPGIRLCSLCSKGKGYSQHPAGVESDPAQLTCCSYNIVFYNLVDQGLLREYFYSWMSEHKHTYPLVNKHSY